MALRLNTVEYAFPQNLGNYASGTVENFSQITIDIPETTNRTFISAFADIFTLDANATTGSDITAWSFGLRVGGTGAFLNRTVTDTIADTAEQMSFHMLFDVSSQFISNFTGTSHVVDASFALASWSHNNTSCKLVITYQWDDSEDTRIKTVRIPIESSTGALGTTLANIRGGGINVPALDFFLPEASKAYKDIFFETWVNEGTTTATATNPTLGFALDNDATDDDNPHEDSGASARLYRRIWQRKDMDTAIPHEFKAKTTTTNMPFRMLGSVLNVTYTYYEPDTTHVMNSILLAGADEIGRAGSTTDADKSRFRRTLAIPETNPILVTSGLQFSFIDSGAVTMNVRVGPQAYTAYSNAANVVCGSYLFMHNFDASSRKGAGLTLSKQGEIVIDWYTGSEAAGRTGTNISALMYLNYRSDKSTLPGGSANHAHTVIPLFSPTSPDTLLNPITRQVIDIPETNRWITSMCPVISTLNSVASNYMIFSAELDASTSIGAGWTDIYVGQIQQDSEFSPIISFARARKKFKRWPLDTDTTRMAVEKSRSYRFQMAASSWFQCYWPITYHTITNYVSGQVSGYTGDGAGISISVYDNNYMEEMIWEGSTGVGGGWGFTWYNASSNVFVGAFQDSTHKGMTQGAVDTSLNITFGGTSGGGETSWVF